MHQQNLTNQIEQLLQQLTDEQAEALPDNQPLDEEPLETIHVYFVRESNEREETIIDATLQTPQRPASLFTALPLLFCFVLPIATILLQVYLAFHPPVATVTILSRVRSFTLTTTVQLGRLMHPITLSQSQTNPTTGKGHRDATQATGTVTFYNGLFTQQVVAPGTLLTGADGVHIITDQEADVPAANPPTFGLATVTAHAVQEGRSGNIAGYDINTSCCRTAIKAVNTTSFTSGQDARDFRTVTQGDIHTVSTVLKTSVVQSVQGAFQGQRQPNEQLFFFPCTLTTTSDHQTGDEATSVTVTVSQTCSAVAYNRRELQENAARLLTSQARRTLGAGYSMRGESQVRVTQITTTHPTPTLTFSGRARFVYGLSPRLQQQLKQRIAGKTKQQAWQLLTALPEVAGASIQWGGAATLPQDTGYIRLTVVVGA